MASVDMHACDEASINTNFMRGTEVTFFAERSKARTAKLLPCDRSPQQPAAAAAANPNAQRLPAPPPHPPFFFFSHATPRR